MEHQNMAMESLIFQIFERQQQRQLKEVETVSRHRFTMRHFV